MSLSLSVDVLGKYKTDIFVETGTHLGGGITTALFVGFKDIYSIEIDLNKYNKIKDLLKYNESVHLYLGDSKDILPKLLSNLSKERITFFLDAHSDDYNPLLYELYIIKNSPRNDHIILIDDRRMMGNQNYQCWKYITEEDVIKTLKEINPNYNIEYENSFNSLKDIIVAWTP